MYVRLTDDRKVLYQWDTNQKLEVSDDVERIDFRYRESRDIVYGVFAKNGKVDVPNVLLQKNGVMDAYVMTMTEGVSTVELMEITVVERPLPPGYFITKQGNVIGYDEFGDILSEMGALLADGSVAMTGAFNMGGHNIENLDDPENDTDAIPRGWANATYLSKSGGTITGRIEGLKEPVKDDEPSTKKYTDRMLPLAGGTMSGSIAMGKQKITDLKNPEENQDAATKAYIDGMRLIFHDVEVPETAFISDSTYEDYGFRADIPLAGVDDGMVPDVVVDAFPVAIWRAAKTYNGGVSIYVDEKPSEAVTIPTIVCLRGDRT